MLSRPVHGWTDITIGDWKDRASYLTSVPCDMLDKVADILENRLPTCVYCDAEGWEYIIVFDHFTTFIIHQEESNQLISVDIKIEDIAKELLKDIKDYFEDWVIWEPDCDKNNVEEYRNQLKEKVERLENLIK